MTGAFLLILRNRATEAEFLPKTRLLSMQINLVNEADGDSEVD